MSKKPIISMLAAGIGLTLLAQTGISRSSKRRLTRTTAERESSRQAADQATRRYLTYVILPVWSVAGFLDWLWHRQTNIETTSGVKESIMHLVMMAEAGAPILTGLFLEMNAGALTLMTAGWLLHELTVAWDVSYSVSRRKIPPREQHTHSYMQTVPFDIIAMLACLHPEQALAIAGLGPDKPDFKLRFRRPAVPLRDVAAVVACMGLVSGLPHLEELWRCYRAQQAGSAGRDTPECAQELFAS